MTAAVWCVFSAYRPDDDGLRRAVTQARRQSQGVVVVDDGSGTGFESTWTALRAEGAEVLLQTSNTGIAAALNRGIRHALASGADAVVTFDQDSVVGEDFVAALRDAAAETAASGAAAPVVPQFFADVDQSTGPAAEGLLPTRDVIQSGMLVPAPVFRELGLLREDLFIDLVDVEFAMRCRMRGRAVVAARGVRLPHRLGSRIRPRLLGVSLPVTMTVSTPFRYYYRVRNRVVLTRSYGARLPYWTARAVVTDSVYFLLTLAAARPAGAMVRVYAAGLRDGLRRRLGPMPGSLRSVGSRIRWSGDTLA